MQVSLLFASQLLLPRMLELMCTSVQVIRSSITDCQCQIFKSFPDPNWGAALQRRCPACAAFLPHSHNV
jgi:hypothetical protein